MPVERVHDLERHAIGTLVAEPVQPRHVGERLLAEAEPQEREHRERRVAEPAVAVVPVARPADVLGQAGRGCRDDGAGREVREQLERDRRAVDDLAPAPAIGALTDPPAPEVDGPAKRDVDGILVPDAAGLADGEHERGPLAAGRASARRQRCPRLPRARPSSIAARTSCRRRGRSPVAHRPPACAVRARSRMRGGTPAGSGRSRARPRYGARSQQLLSSSGMKSVISPTPLSVKKRVTSTAVPGR